VQERCRFQRAFPSKFEFVPSPFLFVLKIFICTVHPGTVLITIEFKFMVPKLWQLVVFCTFRISRNNSNLLRMCSPLQFCFGFYIWEWADFWEFMNVIMQFYPTGGFRRLSNIVTGSNSQKSVCYSIYHRIRLQKCLSRISTIHCSSAPSYRHSQKPPRT